MLARQAPKPGFLSSLGTMISNGAGSAKAAAGRAVSRGAGRITAQRRLWSMANPGVKPGAGNLLQSSGLVASPLGKLKTPAQRGIQQATGQGFLARNSANTLGYGAAPATIAGAPAALPGAAAPGADTAVGAAKNWWGGLNQQTQGMIMGGGAVGGGLVGAAAGHKLLHNNR